MLVKTMSGVFDKLKNLPSLPQEVISGIRGRDNTADKKDDAHLLRDADGIVLTTEFSQQMVWNFNLLRWRTENTRIGRFVFYLL